MKQRTYNNPSRSNPSPWSESTRQLVFSPTAWLKLMFFLHAGDTEVGGFAVTAEEDPLYVQDVLTLSQRTTVAPIELEDSAVADHFDRCVDGGLKPERFARLWWHTHPGHSPNPSCTDEETFARVFGGCDWSIMFIVSRTGRTYTRLAFNAGPGGFELLDTAVDWSAWPVFASQASEASLDLNQLRAEYESNVHPIVTLPPVDHLALAADLDSQWAEFDRFGDAWLEAFGHPMPGDEVLP
jgi:proteasome lid subunit RPN8/RPN11